MIDRSAPTPPDGLPEPHVGAEVPEADAAEQAQPVGREPSEPRPTIDNEVPEADALDQSVEVPFDDDDR